MADYQASKQIEKNEHVWFKIQCWCNWDKTDWVEFLEKENVVFNKLTSWLPISNSNLVMQVSINISILPYEVKQVCP